MTVKEKRKSEVDTTNDRKSIKSNFFDETKNELKKVDWPNRELTMKATVLVVVIMILSTVLIAVADIVFSKMFIFLNETF